MKLRDQPCERCGWRYPGFHVCVDLSKPIDPRIMKKHTDRYAAVRTAEHRRKLSEGAYERWERHREEMAPRDAKIVAAYKDGMTYRELAIEFHLAQQTIMGIIHRAAENGEVQVRPRGKNIRWSRREAS